MPERSTKKNRFNFDFDLKAGMDHVIQQDRDVATLLPKTNLARLVMNHWHDTTTTPSPSSTDCSTSAHPYIKSECLTQFDAVLNWTTGDLNAWSIITARSADAAGDGGVGHTIFTNDTLKEQWLAMWSFLAARYKGTNNIAGYEVMSEPRTAAPASTVHAIQVEACNAVWAHDPRASCIIGSVD